MKISGILSCLVVFMLLLSCDGLGKMVKKQNLVKYELATKISGDSAAIVIKGTYPAGWFAKKAVVTLTPVINYAAGEKSLHTVVFAGEKTENSGQLIGYKKGAVFMYTDKFSYDPSIRIEKIGIRSAVTVGKRAVNFKTKEVDGALLTN